ncbi:MAG: type II toxin-antitoxin system VapC family toxin [bacterium]
MYLLDTNVIIYYLKAESSVVKYLEKILSENVVIYISAITECELFSYPSITINEEIKINELLKSLFILPIDSNIARTAGFLRRTYKMPLADSIIAASSLLTNSILITRNIRDFKKIKNLKIISI